MRRAGLAALLLGAAASVAVAQPAPPPDAPAAAATTPRIAVVVELAVNVEAARVEALSAALADALNRELEVDALGGGDVARRLPATGLPDDCLATPACLADLGARLDVAQLLVIAVVQVGDDIQIDASWVDLASGEVLARPRVELPADARAGEVFADAAPRLLPRARPRPLSVVQPVEVITTPAAPRRRLTRGAWIAGGVGAAALAGGIGFGLAARSRYVGCENRLCDEDEKATIARRALYADALFATAAIGATTAVILYLRSARATEPARPAVTLAPTAGGALVEVRGGF